MSGPSWATLLTGVWADEHGVHANDARPINPAIPSLFERIGSGSSAAVASLVNWSDRNHGHFQRDMMPGTSGTVQIQETCTCNETLTTRAIELILSMAPTFTFVQLDALDHVGHSAEFGAAYDQALLAAAGQVARIHQAVEERRAIASSESWILLVATDHRRESPGGFGHGGQSPSERPILIATDRALSAVGPVPATSASTTILDFLHGAYPAIHGPPLLCK